MSQLQKQINLSMDDKTQIIEELKIIQNSVKNKMKFSILSVRYRSGEKAWCNHKKLYEDSVIGKINSNSFYKILSCYEEEQK